MQKIDTIIKYYKAVHNPDMIVTDILADPIRCSTVLIVCDTPMKPWVFAVSRWVASCQRVIILIPSFTDRSWFASLQEMGFEFYFNKGVVEFQKNSYPRPLAVGFKGLNFEDKIF